MTLDYETAEFIVFSDFDGTITTEDSNDHLTDNLGFGKEKRRSLNIDILHNRVTFRDAFRDMLESVNEEYTFQQAVDRARKNIKLDPGFKEFFEWSKQAKVPVVIVSSGMEPLIRAILENLLGPEDANSLKIVSNDVEVQSDGHFKLKFKHPESHYGHDKSKALRPYREIKGKRPTIFFCGDGVSDMSAAGESDVLFVKVLEGMGNDLAAHCDREKIPYLPFTTFTQVRDKVKDVVDGKITVDEINSGSVKVEEAEKAKKSGRT